MKAAILLIIVLALFFSCSVEETNTNITEIDLSIDLNPIKELKLSQIADDIEFVFLETTKSSLISSIRFIRASQNFILVLDRTRQKALLFSRNGKFLNSIGSYGKGPGEYLQVIDGFISPSEEEVVLLCNGQARSTYVFDIQGNFKSNFAHEFGPAGITSLGNSVIYHVGYPSSLVMNDGFSINIHEEDRSWRHMLKRSVSMPEEPTAHHIFYLSHIDNRVSIWENYFDTIFYINPSLEITPRYAVKHNENYLYYNGPLTMKEERASNRLETSYRIKNLIDCSGFIFINLSIERHLHYTIFDKSADILHHIKDGNIINDIAGPQGLWPYAILNDNIVFCKKNIMDLKDVKPSGIQMVSPEKHKSFLEQVSKHSYKDNPCLIFLTLKNNLSQI